VAGGKRMGCAYLMEVDWQCVVQAGDAETRKTQRALRVGLFCKCCGSEDD